MKKVKKVLTFKNMEEFGNYNRHTYPSIAPAYKVCGSGAVDVTKCWAKKKEIHENISTFLSPAVWELVEKAVKNPFCRDDHMDIIWDILLMNWRCGFSVDEICGVHGKITFFPVSIGSNENNLVVTTIENDCRIIATLDEVGFEKELQQDIDVFGKIAIGQAQENLGIIPLGNDGWFVDMEKVCIGKQ